MADIKKTLVNIVKKLPGGLNAMCKMNENKVQKKYGSLPVNEKKIIFTNYMGKGFGCNCRYVAEELIRRGYNYEYVWAVSDPEKEREKFPKEIRLVKYGSDEMMKEYETAKFWVCNYHLVDLFGHGLRKKAGQQYIQMWHGSFGIKRQEKDVEGLTADKVWLKYSEINSSETDYWISNCKFENDVYTSSFWNVKNIMEYGHPRNDIFFSDTSKTKSKVKQALGIAERTKVMLYIPTYRNSMSNEAYSVDFKAVKDALEKKTNEKWCIAVRLHPKLCDKADEFIDNADYIVDATAYTDIQEVLVSADAVITDYSSAVFDFMLSYKPAFIYATDISEYNTERGFYYNIYTTPFPVAVNNKELVKNIAEFNYDEYRNKVEKFLAEKGSFEDGKASSRVADLIESL